VPGAMAAIAGHLVLLVITDGTGHSYAVPNLHLLDARTGATVRTVDFGEWPQRPWKAQAALTEDGSFAWIAAEPLSNPPHVVRLARPGADPITLDSGAPGALGALGLSGRTLTWTNGGEARSYTLP